MAGKQRSRKSRRRSRDSSRRFVVISLLLLFSTSLFFGWHWSRLYEQWSASPLLEPYSLFFWPLGTSLALTVTGIFTRPFAFLRNWLKRSFESDTRMFLAVIGLTSVGVLLLVNLGVLVKIVLALGVVWLARFDLRQVRIRGWQQFALLSMVSLLGFLGGGGLHWSWGEMGFSWVTQWMTQLLH